MAVNGKYLFGAGKQGVNIRSYLISSNGALQHVVTTEAQKYNRAGCDGFGPLVLDHTGSTLYSTVIAGSPCAQTKYQSFNVEKSSGDLSFLGSTVVVPSTFYPLSFIGNNVYAYSSDCNQTETGYVDHLNGYKRNSNGLLTFANSNAPSPAPKGNKDFFCRSLTAADRTNHLAVSVQDVDSTGTSNQYGRPQLATYTAGTSGNLTTNSTSANMPVTALGTVVDMKMSPSGKLLAVGGDARNGGIGKAGLQIFHFNGASPITRYTGLITADLINQMFWDNENHLYAISAAAGKIHVFTITPTSVSEAPGSPYSLSLPYDLIVQPKTRP